MSRQQRAAAMRGREGQRKGRAHPQAGVQQPETAEISIRYMHNDEYVLFAFNQPVNILRMTLEQAEHMEDQLKVLIKNVKAAKQGKAEA